MRHLTTPSFLTPAILEQPHTAAEYLTWTQSLIAKVKAESDGLKQIRLRIGWAKQLMDEAFPIGLLASKYFGKSEQVSISLKIGSQNFDAVVDDRRKQSSSVQHLEVTMAYKGEEDYLRMYVLHETDEVLSGLGPITKEKTRRTGRTINVASEMVSQEEILRRERDCVCQAIERKLDKKYPPNTFLLIGLPDDTIAFNRPDNIENLKATISDYLPRLKAFHSIAIIGLQKGLFICRPTGFRKQNIQLKSQKSSY